MGWKWEDEGSNPRRGLGEIGELGSDGDRCGTRKIVRSSCRTEEVEPGRFVRKCEKTEQLLRECAGRPVEVVESKTEHTEDDVTEEVKNGLFPFKSSGVEPFNFPGLRSDIEAIECDMLGGINSFLEAAEEMANGFFRSFSIPSWRDRESSPFIRGKPADRLVEKDATKQQTDTSFSGLGGEIRDV